MSAENTAVAVPAKEFVADDPAVLARRVFIGNLTFQTRDQELKTFCETVGPV